MWHLKSVIMVYLPQLALTHKFSPSHLTYTHAHTHTHGQYITISGLHTLQKRLVWHTREEGWWEGEMRKIRSEGWRHENRQTGDPTHVTHVLIFLISVKASARFFPQLKLVVFFSKQWRNLTALTPSHKLALTLSLIKSCSDRDLFTNNTVHPSFYSTHTHTHFSDKKINLHLFIFQVLCLVCVKCVCVCLLIDAQKPRSIIIHFQTSFFTFSLDGWTWCIWSLLPQRGGSRSSSRCVFVCVYMSVCVCVVFASSPFVFLRHVVHLLIPTGGPVCGVCTLRYPEHNKSRQPTGCVCLSVVLKG